MWWVVAETSWYAKAHLSLGLELYTSYCVAFARFARNRPPSSHYGLGTQSVVFGTFVRLQTMIPEKAAYGSLVEEAIARLRGVN